MGGRRGIDRDKLVVSWGTSVLPARAKLSDRSGGWRGRGPDLSWLFSDTTNVHPILEPDPPIDSQPVSRIQMPIYFCAHKLSEMCSLPPQSLWGYVVCPGCLFRSLIVFFVVIVWFLVVVIVLFVSCVWKVLLLTLRTLHWNTSHRITLCFLIVVDVLFVSCSWEGLPLTLRTLRAVTRQDSAVQLGWHCLVWH